MTAMAITTAATDRRIEMVGMGGRELVPRNKTVRKELPARLPHTIQTRENRRDLACTSVAPSMGPRTFSARLSIDSGAMVRIP